jgi:hypothetical protein
LVKPFLSVEEQLAAIAAAMSHYEKKTIPTSSKSGHPSSKRLITKYGKPVSKSDIVARLSGVRISPSPPYILAIN